jgi:two-component system phosphate regulon sensor histidine kinase PhoR
VSISGDPDLLREIFIHLVDNARKFSPSDGSIEIEGASGERETVVSVRDRGIGIQEEHLPYIFERFYRVESELTTQTGGIGLGLSIVKSLVRAHGGSIAVASEPGSGTTFTLHFPARAGA